MAAPMRLAATALALALLSGCASERGVAKVSVVSAELGIFRAAELARVRCLVVAPLENASNAPFAAEAATEALMSSLAASGTRVFPIKDLRALFRDTPFELPEGVPPGLAMELAQLVGADAAIYGTVEGSADTDPGLVVSVRLALSQGRQLLYASTFGVKARPGETVELAMRRGLSEATREMFLRLGGFRGAACFDRKRLDALRSIAVAEAAPKTPAPAPVAAAPAPAATTVTPPPTPPPPAAAPAPAAPRPTLRTPRQRQWAQDLGELSTFIVEDVTFAGRTTQLQRDSGLADLAIALLSSPTARVRIEGHVDATHDSQDDARLSMAMAQAAADRLRELGVPSNRIQVAGRGAESPRLPNFTARGRAANRRIEATGLK